MGCLLETQDCVPSMLVVAVRKGWLLQSHVKGGGGGGEGVAACTDRPLAGDGKGRAGRQWRCSRCCCSSSLRLHVPPAHSKAARLLERVGCAHYTQPSCAIKSIHKPVRTSGRTQGRVP